MTGALLHHPEYTAAIPAGVGLMHPGDTPASIAAVTPGTLDASPALLVGLRPINPPET